MGCSHPTIIRYCTIPGDCHLLPWLDRQIDHNPSVVLVHFNRVETCRTDDDRGDEGLGVPTQNTTRPCTADP